MPVLAALYLFSCFASAGLPMLNGFVGEFLILAGTFQRHAAWASWAALRRDFLGRVPAVVLPACVLRQHHAREERHAAGRRPARTRNPVRDGGVILWMGIGSPFFTRRTEASRKTFCNKCSARRPTTPVRANLT